MPVASRLLERLRGIEEDLTHRHRELALEEMGARSVGFLGLLHMAFAAADLEVLELIRPASREGVI